MTSSNVGMTRVSTEDLLRLLKALHRGTLHEPISRSALIAGAFGHAEGGLGAIVGRDIASAVAMVSAVLAERENARAGKLHLSVQGPAVPGTRSRDMIEQVIELVASAATSIDLCGMTMTDDRRLARSLTAAIEARRLQARVIFAADAVEELEPRIRAYLTSFGLPSTVQAWYAPRAQLRARVVIADQTRVLVGSSDLISTEEDGTFDVGVIIEDANFARALGDEWEKWMRAGELVLVTP